MGCFGVFETLIVDNGKEFYSIALEEACIQLGINIQYAPPLQPWFKASIERYFNYKSKITQWYGR